MPCGAKPLTHKKVKKVLRRITLQEKELVISFIIILMQIKLLKRMTTLNNLLFSLAI